MTNIDHLMGNLLNTSTVFQDETVLTSSYIPQNIPFRDTQLKKMIEHYKGLFRDGGFLQSHLVIVGKEGTGKSLCVHALGKSINSLARRQHKNIVYLHINCTRFRTNYELMNHVMRQLVKAFPKKGLSIAEIMEKLQQHVTLRQMHLILALDNIERLILQDRELLYQLARLWETTIPSTTRETTSPHGLHLILVTRHLDIMKELDKSTFSSLQKNFVFFDDYTEAQLLDILKSRAQKAFLPASVSNETLSFLSEQTEYHQGNCKKVIETLRRAGLIASKENTSKVTIAHIKQAMNEIQEFPCVDYSFLTSLTTHELLVLHSILKEVMDAKSMKKRQAVTTTEIKRRYQEICRQYKMTPLKHTRVWEILQELSRRGLILKKVECKKDPRNPNRRIRGRTTYVTVPFPHSCWNQLSNSLVELIFR